MFEVVDKDFDWIKSQSFDLFLTCSGYEERARYFSKQLVKRKIVLPRRRFVFNFRDFTANLQRKKNDDFFSAYGFENVGVDYDEFGEISNWLNTILTGSGDTFHILVDYSAMKRVMYAEILQFLKTLAATIEISITFVYSVGIPTGEFRPKIISDYVLLPGFEGDTNSQRGKFGVYCLGFEPIILHSIHEWIEPSGCLVFYANPGVKERSGERCLTLNRRFLEENECTIKPLSLYSVQNFTQTFIEFVKTISQSSDVMVFSAGPKPFVLGGLLASSEGIQPSHIYAKGKESHAVDAKPIGRLIITEASRRVINLQR